MSKIFDALKRAESPDRGLMDPIFDQPVSSNTNAVETEVVSIADAVEPQMTETADAPVQFPSVWSGHAAARVVPLHVSALAPVFPYDDMQSQAAEQYRIIRTKIVHHPEQPRVLVVSSPSSGDGKTVTTINLAAIFALSKNTRVLLIDADLRRSNVCRYLGIPLQPGLGEVLNGECTLDEAVVQIEQFPNLWVLPAGEGKRNPAELLASQRWRDIVTLCKQSFSFTVIDATPIAAVADFELIQVACDGVLMVIRPDHSDRGLALKALEIVDKDKFIGAVLNCAEDWFLWKTQDYSYYSKPS